MHTCRADTLIAVEKRRKIEKEKVRTALRICRYPEWALKEEELRGKRQLMKEEETQKGSDQVEEKKNKQYVVLPYVKGVTEATESLQEA